MAPQGFISEDLVFRTFSIINFIFFTIVFIIVLVYRKERPKRLEKELNEENIFIFLLCFIGCSPLEFSRLIGVGTERFREAGKI